MSSLTLVLVGLICFAAGLAAGLGIGATIVGQFNRRTAEKLNLATMAKVKDPMDRF